MNDEVISIPESKSGWRTTEFWLGILAVVLTQLNVIKLPPRYDGIVLLAAVIGYQLSRGLSKQGVPYDQFTKAEYAQLMAGGDDSLDVDVTVREADDPPARKKSARRSR